MTLPATYPVQTFIGSFDVTNYVSKSNLRVNSTRGKLVGSANFVLQGSPLSISNWQVVQIFKADMTERLFYGYIASHSKKKRGVVFDYTVECQSLEVRLQKANVTGSFSGTDSEIITALFNAATPDLTDLFDLSGISDISLADLLFEFNDTELLTAIDEVAQSVGAEYSFDNTGDTDSFINLFRNPNFNTDIRYAGSDYVPDDMVGTTYQNYRSVGSWLPSNGVWNASSGVGGGGALDVTSQNIATDEYTYFRLGRSSNTSAQTLSASTGPSTTEIRLTLQMKIDTTNFTSFHFDVIWFDEDDNYISLTNIGNASTSTGLTTTFTSWVLDNVTLDEAPVNAAYFEIYAEGVRFAATPYTVTMDQILIQIIDGSASNTTYFDGDTSGYVWDGLTNRSTSSGQPGAMAWDTPPDAPYDVDIGSMDEIVGDFDFDFPSFDGINSLIVVGGTSWEDVDWEYQGNNERAHWDLELKIFPADGASFPVMYRNDGNDATPSWTTLTVKERAGNTLTASNDVLLDSDGHWVEFTAPPRDLKRAWRVVGRIQTQIRATVKDDALIESQGVELVDVINDPKLTTTDQAFDIAQAELEARSAPEQITFTAYEPGLFAGQEIDIVDSTAGVSVTMLIETVDFTFLGDGYLKMQVAAGQRTPDLGDIMQDTYQMAEGRPPYTVVAEATALDTLTDSDGVTLTDSDGTTLYQQS